MIDLKRRKCGKVCYSSTGIHGGMTFGRGELDHNGFWQHPCRICAEQFDKDVPAIKADIVIQRILEGESYEEATLYVENADWLNIPAHPYKDKSHE